ncbi:MAG: hypothetical protein OXR73_02130, partial [Myxococcales bacterium]|nr:hypothetical protein [Myxococcales bacterium]
FERVIELVARPKRRTNSYALHIGMETMARFRLLCRLSGQTRREWARKQAVAMASAYQHLDEDLPAPPPAVGGGSKNPLERLLAAVDVGEVDDADRYAGSVASQMTSDLLIGPLANATLAHLGAAGHAPIFLSLAHRVGTALPTMTMLPTIARGLAEGTQHRLGPASVEDDQQLPGVDRPEEGESIYDAFNGALLRAPHVGPAAAGGIRATVEHAMRHTGPALAIEQPLRRWTRDRAPTRAAAHAALAGVVAGAARLMLEEPRRDAKYHWTHCLTIPQGVWALSPVLEDRTMALRVATTLAVAFVATKGKSEIRGPLDLPDGGCPLAEALTEDPTLAAAAAWQTPPEAVGQVHEQLAFEASARNDAHLVKFVLACLDGAAMNRRDAPLYRAAAAYLTSIWVREVPADQLPEHLHSRTRVS